MPGKLAKQSMQGEWRGTDGETRAKSVLHKIFDDLAVLDSHHRLYCEVILLPALAKEAKPEDRKHYQKIVRIIDWISGDCDDWEKAMMDEETVPQHCRWVGKFNKDGIPQRLINLQTDPKFSLHMLNDLAAKANHKRRHVNYGYDPNRPMWAGTRVIHDDLPGDLMFVRCTSTAAIRWDAEALRHCAANTGKPYLAEAYKSDDMNNGMFSVRTRAGTPIVTIRVSDGKITDCAGVQNAPVLPKYFPAVEALMQKYQWRIWSPSIGFILWRGQYHSVYNIPEGYEHHGTLDISFANQPITFNGIKAHTLTCNDNQSPHAMPIDGIDAKYIHRIISNQPENPEPSLIRRHVYTGVIVKECFYLDHFDGNGFHRETYPASIARDAKTGEVTHSGWYSATKAFEPSRAQKAIFNLQEEKKRKIWQTTGVWPVTLDDIKRPTPTNGFYVPRI
ncbi:MAG: hypothetical protein AAF569_01905 [Pseudomonadota bacterium]